MKVLLIKPTQNISATANPAAVVTAEAGIYPPLGLIQLATYEILRGKHEIKIIDAIAEGLNYQQLELKIGQEKPNVVGVTLHTDNLGDGYLVLKSVRKISREIVTIAGGPHVAMYPHQTIEFPEVDYAVCGEAEYVFGEMLDRIAGGRQLDDIPGVLSKTNTDKPVTKLEIDNLEGLPIPDYRLVPYKRYNSIVAKKSPIAVIMTTRGCPFNCAYCPAGRTKLRKRSPKLVADEIEQCLSLGMEDILFFDEVFTIDPNRVKELCNEFSQRGLKFRWNIRSRIKDVNREMVDLLKISGCNLIQFGIESGTERIQKLMRKNLDLKEVEEKIRMVRDAGILTYGNFMLGSPTETPEEINQTIEFAIRLKLDFAVFGITILLPKTEYYEMAIRENKIKEDFWIKYVKKPLVPIENACWPDFERKFLEDLCKKAYLKFYLRPEYIYNYITKIATPSQILTRMKSMMAILKNWLNR